MDGRQRLQAHHRGRSGSRCPAFHRAAYSSSRIAPYLAIRSAFAWARGAAFLAL
ncbi:hypothetical protein ACR6C2_04515 [Streptomyces sp. INA 01156]